MAGQRPAGGRIAAGAPQADSDPGRVIPVFINGPPHLVRWGRARPLLREDPGGFEVG